MAASARDPRTTAAGTDVLPPVTAAQRSWLGIAICVVGILAAAAPLVAATEIGRAHV